MATVVVSALLWGFAEVGINAWAWCPARRADRFLIAVLAVDADLSASAQAVEICGGGTRSGLPC